MTKCMVMAVCFFYLWIFLILCIKFQKHVLTKVFNHILNIAIDDDNFLNFSVKTKCNQNVMTIYPMINNYV
jgi:hypothetical protein